MNTPHHLSNVMISWTHNLISFLHVSFPCLFLTTSLVTLTTIHPTKKSDHTRPMHRNLAIPYSTGNIIFLTKFSYKGTKICEVGDGMWDWSAHSRCGNEILTSQGFWVSVSAKWRLGFYGSHCVWSPHEQSTQQPTTRCQFDARMPSPLSNSSLPKKWNEDNIKLGRQTNSMLTVANFKLLYQFQDVWKTSSVQFL